MTGFVGECFHVFNKHASSSAVKPYFETDEVSHEALFCCHGFGCAGLPPDIR